MPKRYRPAEVIKVLESFGWTLKSQRGSHIKMTKAGEPNHVSVPRSRREVRMGTFKAILRQARISSEEFEERAREVG